jgi:hypothetical protein
LRRTDLAASHTFSGSKTHFGGSVSDRKKHQEEELMANANSKHMGSGATGKGSGNGAMTDIDKDILPENMVLSNRDKAQHSRERGLDSKTVQTEQFHDHEANHLDD